MSSASFIMQLLMMGAKELDIPKFMEAAHQLAIGTRYSLFESYEIVLHEIAKYGADAVLQKINNQDADQTGTAVDISSQLSLTASENKTGHA